MAELIHSFLIIPKLIKIPTAIAKSKEEPSFLISAGAKFTLIFFPTSFIPVFFIATVILSFDYFILVPNIPTISQCGIPADKSTCASTTVPSVPFNAIVFTIDNKFILLNIIIDLF